MLQEVLFDQPMAFYLTFIVPVIVWILWRLYLYRQDALSKFGRSEVLKVVVRERSPHVFWGKTLAVCLLWMLLSVALAEPKGNGRYPDELAQQRKSLYAPNQIGQTEKQLVQRQAHEVIFMIDASGSMAIPDGAYGKTRLETAKEIADQITSLLKGQTASLFAFTSTNTQLSPETNDYLFLRMMLNQVRINEGDRAGTDFYEAMIDVRKKYLEKPTNKAKTLIILSDGGDTRLEEQKGDAYEKEVQGISALLGDAVDNGMRVFTIGIGSKEGSEVPEVTYQGGRVVSQLEEKLLQKLSQSGGGRYYDASQVSPLVLANDLVSRMDKGPTIEEMKEIRQHHKGKEGLEEEFLVYDLYFQYPLGIAILLLAFLLLFPETSSRRVP